MLNLNEPRYQIGDIVMASEPTWKDGEPQYFLVEGPPKIALGGEWLYPFRWLNDGSDGWGNLNHPSTIKVA